LVGEVFKVKYPLRIHPYNHLDVVIKIISKLGLQESNTQKEALVFNGTNHVDQGHFGQLQKFTEVLGQVIVTV